MLANADLWSARFLMLLLFVGLPAALVSPAVWARRRNGWALLAMVLGVWLSAASFVEALHGAVQYQAQGELWDWLSCVWLVVYGAMLGTGLMGAWRWFRLPRG